MMLVTAVTRNDIANYVGWVFYVYILIIFLYILVNWLFTAGVRPPYSRFTDAVLTFLRDTSEPYLRLFRRFIPPLGMLDLSPIVAIVVLYLLRYVVTQAIGS
jgi:YggT family protein